jgi:dTDP-4-dehydrorhamnose 3,5-epimerase
MTFSSLGIKDAYLIQDQAFIDERGKFTENWEVNNFALNGLQFAPSNSCFSFNKMRGTLRGLHYQSEPSEQSKLVTCVAGNLYDVIVDLRVNSPTYMQWNFVELAGFSGNSVFIPGGCAHGFMTLSDETVVSYLISGDYVPSLTKVVRFNDPAFNISWPGKAIVISQKDLTAPDYFR